MRRLFEKKEDEVKKQKLLSDKEKNIVINFFNDHPEQDKKCKEFGIDWNRHDIPFERFYNLITSFNERFLPKLTLKDLKEGKDYRYLGRDNYYDYYFILSYKGSVTIASNNVAPEVWTTGYGRGYDTAISVDENALKDYPVKVLEDGTVVKGGAKWCTAFNHTSAHWDDYIDYSYFIYACAYNDSIEEDYKKVAIRFALEDVDTEEGDVPPAELPIEMYNTPDQMFDGDKENDIIYAFICRNEGNIYATYAEFNDLKEEEKRRAEELKRKKEAEMEAYKNSLPRKNFSYYGYDFPMIEMGERPEGKVFGSYYLTADEVPFSPRYEGNKYGYGSNRWDISIVRQWLNSDKPAGQWFKEYEVDRCKVDWKRTYISTINFIKNTDGFLKIIGLSKSQLNPVKNITYTSDGKEIITEDYVWIPSLTELSTQNKYKEGEPLDYWKKLLGNNATSQVANSLRAMKSCDTIEPYEYWTRSTVIAESTDDLLVNNIECAGYGSFIPSLLLRRLYVLVCFKS